MLSRTQTRIGRAILDLSLLLQNLIFVGENANILRFIQGSNIESPQCDIIGLQILFFLIAERSVSLAHIACVDRESKYRVGSFAD